MVLRRFLACRAHLGAPLAILQRVARSVPPLLPLAERAHRALDRYSDGRSRAFDRQHGTDTYTRVPMKKLGLRDEHGQDFDNWAYGPICPDFFHEMMRQIPKRPELSFYDVGCGKGLPLLLAGDHGFRRVVGIELSPDLCDLAKRNIERYSASVGRPIVAAVICGDFLKQELPDEPTVFFLNNPFPHYIARLAVAHIEASIAAHPRRVVIAYRRMPLPTLRQLEASPHLALELTTPYWQIFSTR
jgi:SAM-dependent methyltransferase